MSDSTVALVKKAFVSAGAAPAAPVITIGASLVNLDFVSLAIAIGVAGIAAVVSAASRFDRENRKDVPPRVWFMEFGIGAIAGLTAWGLVSLGGFDPRVQLAAIALSGWSGRPFLDGSMWIWKQIRGQQ